MGIIRKLPKEVAERIAAGEVVERPASVLKELIENALDAQAQKITVSLEDGGIRKITVADDGVGIAKDDLRLAVASYTTSKISRLEDLERLVTFGFRGEALAAISKVAKVSIHSRTPDSKVGYLYKVFEDTIVPLARNVGTTVVVEDLFYNVPARRKFLRTVKTELKHDIDIFLALAFANPLIHLKLEHNNRVLYDLVSRKDLLSRYADVTGYQTSDLLDISRNFGAIKVEGVVVRPDRYTEGKRVFKILVNNRVVEDRYLQKAVNLAFEDFVLKSSQIAGVIKVFVDPYLVDVNVHPRKIEVKFKNPYRVMQFVQRAIKERLGSIVKDTVGRGTIYLPKPSLQPTVAEKINKIEIIKPRESSQKISSSVSSFLPLRSLRQVEESSEIKSPKTGNIVQMIQLMNRYILVEFQDRIWIIDQHAAAERIRFEELGGEERIDDVKQKLLRPLTIKVEKDTVDRKELLLLLHELGIEAEFNEHGGVLKVYTAPSFIPPEELTDFINQLLEIITEEKGVLDLKEYINRKLYEPLRYAIATKACHSSVRANEPLTQEQIEDLVLRLLKCKYPHVCPHGRPVIWEILRDEIDRHFLRL